ncbi:MAG: hypothetical protein LIP28_09590 [Deltaproteobacteria bacterium]|nr:hypothetical protein [Deltaproteobacteria bacterium]
MDARNLTMRAQVAKNARTIIPTPPSPNVAYRNTALDAEDVENGQSYMAVWDSAKNNQLDYEMSGLIMEAERYGIMRYSPLTDYAQAAVCLGTDGVLYQAAQPSGPGTAAGPQPTDNAAYWGKAVQAATGYELCEFYFFRHPTLRPGFQPAQGGLLVNAAMLYPEAWAYLQTAEGRLLCKTEAEWQAMTTATWATLADGTEVGWNGIGGAPFYAPDRNTGALRLPDLRGMYAEAAGFDSLDVGGVHGDGIPRLLGSLAFSGNSSLSSAFRWSARGNGAFLSRNDPNLTAIFASGASGTSPDTDNYLEFDSSRQIATFNKTQPRAFGALACVYLGLPR